MKTWTAGGAPATIDRTDAAILALLQNNGRLSNKEIAAAVGLAPSSAHERLKRLKGDEQTLKAFLEAEAYDGPSLIIAYSHCIAHGINMSTAMSGQKLAVDSGQWLLYRYHPERADAGQSPLLLDSRAPSKRVEEFLSQQARFKMLARSNPEVASRLWKQAQQDAVDRFRLYEGLAQQQTSDHKDKQPAQP